MTRKCLFTCFRAFLVEIKPQNDCKMRKVRVGYQIRAIDGGGREGGSDDSRSETGGSQNCRVVRFGRDCHPKIAPINVRSTEWLIKLQQLNLATSVGETIYLEHRGE